MSGNAREKTCVHLSLSVDYFRFIATYDPERERSASRRDIVTAIEEIQTILLDGGPRDFNPSNPDWRDYEKANHCPNCSTLPAGAPGGAVSVTEEMLALVERYCAGQLSADDYYAAMDRYAKRAVRDELAAGRGRIAPSEAGDADRVEAVARALWVADSVVVCGESECCTWESITDDRREQYLRLAVAAIAAVITDNPA